MKMIKTKMWYIQPVAYYMAVKNEWTTDKSVWINLRIVLLSEKHKSHKTVHSIISFV